MKDKVVQVCDSDGYSVVNCQYVDVGSLSVNKNLTLTEMLPVITVIGVLMGISWVAKRLFKILEY